MNFNWDEFTAEDFVNYCASVENKIVEADYYIGAIRVGEICCDLVVREYNTDKLTLTYDIYVGGENTGYGYTSEEKYPYDYAGGDDFPDSCISMTYEDFKKMAEKEITEFLTKNNLLNKANMKLHKW